MASVLLVDDDSELVEMMADYLERDGFKVETASDGEQGLIRALSGEFSIIVLDVMMPQMNGIQILNQLRKRSNIPVLMLTARGDDIDRIVGLEQGADDYVPKPCTAREISARIRAILRRSGAIEEVVNQPVSAGALAMWPEQRRAVWQGNALDLTSTEFNLLEVLARNAGRTVSKTELSEQALGRPLQKFDRSIEVHLSKIREKLGPLSDGRSCIQTIFRQGYQFIKS
jgi:two-component system, OmpR family, response regulator